MALPRCKHLSGRDDARLSRDRVYQCGCPLPNLPDLPISVTASMRWPPVRTWVTVGDCAKCPMIENYKR